MLRLARGERRGERGAGGGGMCERGDEVEVEMVEGEVKVMKECVRR